MKNIIIWIVIIAIIVVGYLILKPSANNDNTSEDNSDLEIETEIKALDVGDLDAEFQAIDKELESL